MSTACFARVLQKCTGRLHMEFHFVFQTLKSIGKTRNQLQQKRPSTGQGADNLLPLSGLKNWVPDGACGHGLSCPTRMVGLPASGLLWATSIPVSSGGVKTHVCMDDVSASLGT
jgi:hypothetical protein